jgi:hypothetical protein
MYPAPAAAQTRLERSALERAVRDGRTVMVEVDAPGDSVIGRLRAVDADAIEIALGSGVRRVSLSDIARIYREGDSVANGAATGAAVMGGWCAIICGQGTSGGGDYVRVVVVNALTGAGIGALLDLATEGTTTLYRRRAKARVTGLISPQSIGVGATVRW